MRLTAKPWRLVCWGKPIERPSRQVHARNNHIGGPQNGKTVIAADGQVSIQHTIVKANTNKLRRLNDGRVLAGFAGSTADAFCCFDLFEKKS